MDGTNEVMRVEGGTPPGLANAANEIRAEARRLSADLQEFERLRAADEIRLAAATTDAQKAHYQARIAAASAAAEQTRVLIQQQTEQYRALNATIAQRPAAPPPTPPPPQPLQVAVAGGGGGGPLAALGLTSAGLTSLAAQYLSIYAAVRLIGEAVSETLGTLKGWAETGVKVNEQLELMRAGLAASVAQNFDVTDAQGKQLTGLEKINALSETSVLLQDRIIAGAIRTGTSIEAYATAYRLVVPLSKDFGLSLDQSLNVTEALVLAGRSLGLSLEAVKSQISQILSGHVNVRSVLARELFGGDATSILSNARAQGTLIDLVTEKTKAYTLSQQKLADTFAFTSNAAQVAGEVLLKEATSGGFQELKVALKTVLDYAMQFDEVSKTYSIRPEFKGEVAAARDAFREFVLAAIDLSPLLIQTFAFVAKSIGDVVAGLGFAVEMVDRARAEGYRQQGEKNAADAQQTLDSLKLDSFPALEKIDPGLRRKRLAEAAQLAKDSSDAYEKAKELEDEANRLKQARNEENAAAMAADRAVANVRIMADRVHAAIAAEDAKPKPTPGPAPDVRPQSPDARQGDTVAGIKLAAARQLLDIGEQEITVAEARAALEGRRASMSASEYERAAQILAVRKAELEVASADARVIEAARVAAVKGPADKEVGAQAAQALLNAQLAAVAAREKLNKAILDTSHLTKAEEAELEREAALQASAVRLADTERLAAEEGKVLDVERQSLAVHRATIDTDYAERQAAESKVVIATAELNVVKARLKLQNDEAELARQLAMANSPTANPEQRGAAQLAADKALEAVIRDRLDVSQAVFNVAKQTTAEFDKQTEAIRRSVEEMGGLKSILSDIADAAGLFSGGVSKGLQQIMSAFDALGKVQANFVKTASQDIGQNFTSMGDVFKDLVHSWTDFKSLFENGGKGIVDLAGAVVGPLVAGIQDLQKPGTLSKALGGLKLGATIGSILPGIGTAMGAVIGASLGTVFSTHNVFAGAATGFLLGGPVGGILGGFFASERKQTEKIAKQIQAAVDATVKKINDGSLSIKDSLAQLAAERADAVARLSGQKGGADQLKQITDQIDQATAALKKQQKQIFDQFQSQLRVLQAGSYLQGPAQAVEQLNQNVKQFLDAGGSALDAQKYIALSLQGIYADTNSKLTDAQKSTIDLLQQEVDLQKQRDAIVKQANDQENQIRQQQGIVRVQSAAQTAGQQIAKVEADKKAALDAADKQKEVLDAQIGGLAELFGLGKDELSLQAARLAILKQQSSETVLQVRALQDFLSLNSAAFAAASKTAFAQNYTVPSLNGGALTQGAPVFTFAAGSINIVAGAGMTPQQYFQQFIDGVRGGMGASRWRLDAAR